ncbi:MAG: FtsW/RodA/SpoVE family cell cycle protein [Anaerolineae bacterium]|nr:FtsW/RodA/SpoVE family cell cycle protein [Anaerolineae bacterium]MCI0609773.1 FtsW/RodA/SpoVE family cell cycle protein [Anaerolineae bacterium]
MNRVTQSNLLKIAAVFLVLQTLIMTLSPGVRARTWETDYRWSQWVALAIWGFFTWRAHGAILKRLPDADPYLFPAAALLSGWGLLTVWRLDSTFGARQAIWLGISMLVLYLGTRLPTTLDSLRKYKYLLLTAGLMLTGLTLFFGTNPLGYGPRLWLGCCGVFFQPSEPLKLLLVAYLAAYLADRLPIRLGALPLLYPTLLLSGIAILLLYFQRDLGTASIFLALYTSIIYLATQRRRAVLVSVGFLVFVGVAGYYFVDIVRARIDSWLNPWDDPSGGSYQIIQSLMAIANGGLEGRGPGLGSPALVPVAISDFIFAAIAEETGLMGTVGLIALFGLILSRGLRIALRAPNLFRRFFAAGISAYIGIQALLIMGGNLRLLPLTGVTLPFISYGGSSLLTSFIALLFLLLISNHLDEEPAPLPRPRPYLAFGVFLSLGLFTAALTNGWWAIVRGPDLLMRTDNSRRVIEDNYVIRGMLLDRANIIINSTEGETGSYTRIYKYPDLASVAGYNHPVYGQAGLESSLDEYLRGLKGNPASAIWWNHLLYGMSPEGLDVRLSIDLYLQYRTDQLMLDHHGAAILLNAASGEIFVMSSHPTFNPNQLNEIGPKLNQDPNKPLINRAVQGLYPIDSLVNPFAIAIHDKETLDEDELKNTYEALGFYRAPQLRIQVAEPLLNAEVKDLHVSPLQVALASAALSNHGTVPAPRIATAVNTPEEGWIVLPALGTSFTGIQASAADETAESLIVDGESYWAHTGSAKGADSTVTWFIAGTPPNWQATPMVVVVLLEEDNARLAEWIGRELLVDAMNP